MALFRGLEAEWYSLEVDYEDLVLLDLSKLPPWMAKEAEEVLKWGLVHLESGTWLREDYLELLQLTIIVLGGKVPGFRFRLPGADHHARWMSKVIYFTKIFLLSKVFLLQESELVQVHRFVIFAAVLYVKAWLEAPLPSSAARNDVTFQQKILRYREVEPRIAFEVLKSCRRHHWYLTGQMVTLALTDPGLSKEEKEELARRIHGTERIAIDMGKPSFPVLDWTCDPNIRPSLASMVTPDSWLIFNILQLLGPQDWLQTPSAMWHLFEEYRKLESFSRHLSVVNNLAERVRFLYL